MKNKSSAFTLIELLVVIVIIGILATIGIAQFNEYQERARFAKAQAFAAQVDSVLMAETSLTGYGFPLRLDFEEGSGQTTVDSSGSANDVSWTASGISWSTDTPDNSNSSIDINAESIRIRNVKNMPTDEITFTGFIRINERSSSGTYPFFISNNSGFIISETGRTTFYIDQGADNVFVDGVIKVDRWHHLLGSFKNGQLRLFVDGNLVAQSNRVLDIPFNINGSTLLETPSFNVGYSVTGREFKGSIDRLRIYPVGLDPNNL